MRALIGGLMAMAMTCFVMRVDARIVLKTELEKRVLQANTRQDALINISIFAPEQPMATAEKRARINLSVVLDKSGSMGSQKKLENAKEAAIAALNRLGSGDVFSLVVYDNSARTIIPATTLNPANRESIISRINAITSGGSTALFAGVSFGANEIRRHLEDGFVNRIILLSDGLANVGPQRPEELGRLGASLLKENISVSTVGVGSDYNEDLMTLLSQNSDGNFYFVENSQDLPMIFGKELGSTLKVAATSIHLKIVCPKGVVPKGILGHDCRINGNTIEMDFNQVYSGHEKYLILQVEVPPEAPKSSLDLANVVLSYEGLKGEPRISMDRTVNVTFSGNEVDVRKSLNKEVYEKVALQKSAVLREEAIQQADKGDFKKAERQLDQASQVLNEAYNVTGNVALKDDAAVAEQRAKDMKKSKSSSLFFNKTRKRLKGESYQTRNQQLYQQKAKK